MSYFKLKSHAKINLALNVTGKIKSLHKIESIVSFLTLHDEIFIKSIKDKNHIVKFIGKFSKNIKSKNTVSQLLENLEKKKFLKKKFKILIKKNIPSKAGLGGGSMNSARIFNFLKRRNFIKLSTKDMTKILKSVGSDVILGIYSKNLILKSNGLIKTFNAKKRIYVLVVKPSFGCSTKKIYSKLKKYTKPKFNNISKNMFSLDFLKTMDNNLEAVSFKKYPKLNTLKKFLEKLSGVKFVRMTGSGSAIIGYFNSDKKCKEAEKIVKKKFRNYWCKTSKTI